MKRFVLLAALLAFVCAAAYADTIVLTNGNKLRGKIVSENEKEVVINVSNMGTITVKRTKIKGITKDEHTGPSNFPAQPKEEPGAEKGEKPGEPEEAKGPSVEELKKAIAKVRPLHKKLGKPEPGDFLATSPQPPQSFEQYTKSNPTTPDDKRDTIYIQPLGKFTDQQRRVMRITGDFLSASCGLPVKFSTDLPLTAIPEKSWRVHPALGHSQANATDVLRNMMKPRVPLDAAGYLTITSVDLFSQQSDNFLFGKTSLRDRVSIMSISRLGQPDAGDKEFKQTLLRAMQAGARSVGRMFSVSYCVTYECVMCGSNSLDESDRRPVWLCPECMAKVCWATKTQPVERYEKLVKFAKMHGLAREQEFYEKSLKALGSE